MGSPIRQSWDQRFLAPTPRVSPLGTTFVGARAEPSTRWRSDCSNEFRTGTHPGLRMIGNHRPLERPYTLPRQPYLISPGACCSMQYCNTELRIFKDCLSREPSYPRWGGELIGDLYKSVLERNFYAILPNLNIVVYSFDYHACRRFETIGIP